MATSQNGYSVDPPLNKDPFPGTNIVAVPGVRKGNVATVLHYVGSKFDKNVEKLVNPGCWGYANRPIRGSTVTSNHASGTAIDLNAPKHPLGASGTFSAKQKAEIRKILNYCDGVVRWGGDYSDRKDEMHFEINKDSKAVASLAKKIKGGTVETMEILTSAPVFNARYYLNKNPDVNKEYNVADADKHWLKHGISEGRASAPNFHVKEYTANYPDLQKAYGKDYKRAVIHYFKHGINELRKGIK